MASEQNLRELKRRISTLLAIQKNTKIKHRSPNAIIEKAIDNVNSLPTAKHGIEPNKIEKNSLASEAYREWFDIRRLSKVSKTQYRYERYEKNKYLKKRKQLRVPLEIGENVLLFASRLKKKRFSRFILQNLNRQQILF